MPSPKLCPHCGYVLSRALQQVPLAPAVVPAELAGLQLYAKDSILCRSWPTIRPEWDVSFPGLDVLAQVRMAHAWEMANPTRRKVNRISFLTNWLTRSQDKGVYQRRAPEPPPEMAWPPSPKKSFEEKMAEAVGTYGVATE